MKRFLKVSLAVVALLGLLVGGLVVTGQPRGVVRNTATVAISAPPAAVFPFLVEPERLKSWMGGLTESVPLTEGGPRVGARSREVVEQDGRRVELITELTAYEVNRRLHARITSDGFAVEARYLLRENAGSTVLSYETESTFDSVVFRVLAPLIQSDVQAKLEQDLARLRKLSESGLTVEAGPR